MDTGMRQGEILALKPSDLRECGEAGYIDVRYSMDRVYGLKEPKCGSYRIIPLSTKMNQLLRSFTTQEGIAANEFIFHGESRDTPIDYKATNRALYRALAKIGIDNTNRKERNITFHSWRHFFNTNMRGKISDDKLRLLTGHRTKTMTEHYTYNDFERVQDVISVQESVFDKMIL
jgi:integrase